MATRNIVPRANEEGGIGTSVKKWLSGYIKNLYSPNFVLGSDADGDMYYRASSLLARLAKGAPNFKLFMNAAGAAPEWASGWFMKEESRAMDAASGDVSYTGYGFKPAGLIVLAGINGTPLMSVGVGLSTTDYCVSDYGHVTPNYWSQGSFIVIAWEASGKGQYATIKSMDADGFILTWTRAGATASATLTIKVLAFR
jgi:hypothetical protein